MKFLLAISRGIDALNTMVGRSMYWLILVSAVISAANAVVRYTISYSSNAFLEMQWYLTSAVFLLCAGYALLHRAHVSIDLIAGRLSHRVNAWIEVFGLLFMLLPVSVIIMDFGWDAFVASWVIDEVSTDVGGLLRWPVKILIPIGFALLILQGLSELIKRVAYLRGLIPWTGTGVDPDGDSQPAAGTN